MGPTAGFKALEIVERARYVLASELLTAAQESDLRALLCPTKRLADVHERIRESVPFLSEDRAMSDDIELLAARIATQALFQP
jgi:histidine ammonia-lyase